SALPANNSQLRRERAIRTHWQRGDFTVGSLLELLDPHLTRNGRQGISFVRKPKYRSRLGETDHAPEFNVGKIPHIREVSKLFFWIFLTGGRYHEIRRSLSPCRGRT